GSASARRASTRHRRNPAPARQTRKAARGMQSTASSVVFSPLPCQWPNLLHQSDDLCLLLIVLAAEEARDVERSDAVIFTLFIVIFIGLGTTRAREVGHTFEQGASASD